MRLSNRFGEGLQPTLWLPLQRVFAPDGLVAVASTDPDDDCCVLGNWDLTNHCTVFAYDGLGEGHDDVLSGPMRIINGMPSVYDPVWVTYSRPRNATGACL